MLIDDLILCSLQGFSPLQVFGSVSRCSGITPIPSQGRLLNAQVAKILALSLPSENISVPRTIYTQKLL